MNEQLQETLERSEVVSITGRRGSGKSSLGFSILEHDFKPNAYVIGLDEQYKHLLPESITLLPMNAETLENLPAHATIFCDEAAFYLYARDSGKPLNKIVSKIVMDARKLDQLFVFATHTYRKFEIGAILDVDTMLFREPSILHARFERKEILDLIKTAKREFDKIDDDKHKYAYLISQDYEGMLEVELPSFWTEELSHAVASVINSEVAETKKAKEQEEQEKYSYLIGEEVYVEDEKGIIVVTIKEEAFVKFKNGNYKWYTITELKLKNREEESLETLS